MPTNKPTTKTAIDDIAGVDITNLYLLYLIKDCVCLGSEDNIITEHFSNFLMLLTGSHYRFINARRIFFIRF